MTQLAFPHRAVGDLTPGSVNLRSTPTRLPPRSRQVQRSVFASCGQEAFFEGHVHALRTLGGVPRTKVRYDNLKAAVARVLGQSRGRVEADRWVAFRSHLGIESFYELVSEPEARGQRVT